jgi:hypothetical protein
MELFHNGSNSFIDNYTGDMYIRQNADDKDLIFQCDDGSGGGETYFFLDGSFGSDPYTIFPDSSVLTLGTGADLRLYHDGSHSYIKSNGTGNVYIMQQNNDADISFWGDDGAGGDAEYFRLDGSMAAHDGSATTALYTIFPDKSIAAWGTGADLRIDHSGSHSYIYNTTGNLEIINYADDSDIIFKCDDGSGGVETYFYLDGSASAGAPFTVFPDSSNLTTRW